MTDSKRPWAPKSTPPPAPEPEADTPETVAAKAKQARRVMKTAAEIFAAPPGGKRATHPTRVATNPAPSLPIPSQAPRSAPVPRSHDKRSDRR